MEQYRGARRYYVDGGRRLVGVEESVDDEGGGEEAKKRQNIPLQEKFHRGILRGLRNISDTP